MFTRRHAVRICSKPSLLPVPAHVRRLLTLAIETSCDDTAVTVLERRDHANGTTTAKLHFDERVSSDVKELGGIQPIVALESHMVELAPMVQRALTHLPRFADGDRMPATTDMIWGDPDGQLRRKPDFISVTRGPGMRTNLLAGVQTAKGLAVAWNIPLLGVHHMQAHALTPRLISALADSPSILKPEFPFLTLLVSGGHTMLLSSDSLTSHTLLADTADTAIGNCLDKCARAILTPSELHPPFGASLEAFAFPSGAADHDYDQSNPYHWTLPTPLAVVRGGLRTNRMAYSFTGLTTTVERAMGLAPTHPRASVPSLAERRHMARELQREAFAHLASRISLHLAEARLGRREGARQPAELVVAGGVAGNAFLMRVLRDALDGDPDGCRLRIVAPPARYCTDNAAMIAWAGTEMWEAGWRNDLSIVPVKKWGLDAMGEDGGILGIGGWTNVRA